MSYSYHISRDNTITLFGTKEQVVVPQGHQNYEEVKKLVIKKAPLAEVLSAVRKTIESKIVQKAEEKGVASQVCKLSGDGQTILLNGQPIHNSLTARALELKRQGFPLDPFLRFLENLAQNPSARAVSELYDFLDHRALPLTEDGHFLAYKSVRADFMDVYSGKFDNSPGKVVEIPRNQVDDDRAHECSYGLHVGGSEYVRNYGGYNKRIVVVKVNPKDCVAVPRDHNAQKLRVCRYEVLHEVNKDQDFELQSAAYSADGEDWDLHCDEAEEWEDNPDWTFDEIEDQLLVLNDSDLYEISKEVGLSFGCSKYDIAEELYNLQEEDPESFDNIVMCYF